MNAPDTPEINPIESRVANSKGLHKMTTGREPSYVIMNVVAHRALMRELNAVSIVASEGVPIAVLPADQSTEPFVEVV